MRLDLHQVAEQPHGAAPMALDEPGAGGLLDVAAAGFEEIPPGMHAPPRLLQLFDPIVQLPAFVLERRAPLRERRGLPVHRLDVVLDGLPLGLGRADPRAERRELSFEAFALMLLGQERALDRLDLGAAAGGLFADPAPQLLDLATAILRLPVPIFRAVELPLVDGKPVDDLRELDLDPADLGLHGFETDGARRLGGEFVPGGRLRVDRGPVGPFRALAIDRRRPEALLRLAEPDRGRRPRIRGGEDLFVEFVESCPGRRALVESLLPAAAAPLLLAQERPQTRARELPREVLRLLRERFVLRGHLGLLLQGFQLATELGEHVGEPKQILVEPRELPLGPLLPAPVLRDARRFLDVAPPVLGLRKEDLLQLPLPDDRVEGAPDPRIPTAAPGRPSAGRAGRRSGTRTPPSGRSSC